MTDALAKVTTKEKKVLPFKEIQTFEVESSPRKPAGGNADTTPTTGAFGPEGGVVEGEPAAAVVDAEMMPVEELDPEAL